MTAIGGGFGPLIIGLLTDHAGLSICGALTANGFVMSVLAYLCIVNARNAAKRSAGFFAA